MKVAALLSLTFSAGAALAEPVEVARTFLFNQEAVLYDDGTWDFDGLDITITKPDEAACLKADAGRISICPDAGDWTARVIFSTENSEEHQLFSTDERFALTLQNSADYGHYGDMSLYDDVAAASDGFLTRLLLGSLGFEPGAFSEEVYKHEDFVILLSRYNDPGYGGISLTAEVIGPERSAYIDLTETLPSDDPDATDAAAEVAAQADALFASLMQATTIDSQSLATIMEIAQQ